MPPVINTRNRTSDLDQELENAGKEFSALEREEAELRARQQAEYKRWISRKAEKFRPTLDLFLKVFSCIRELDNVWRRQVFQGQEEFDRKTESSIRRLYAIWLGYSAMFVDKAEYLNRQGENCDADLDMLGRNKREAGKLLRTWEPPVLSQVPSFRSPPLSVEATERLRTLFPGKA